MSNEIIFNAPINGLSFGNVSYNFLKELHRRETPAHVFPIGNGVDLSTFDEATNEFKVWLNDGIKGRLKRVRKDYPSLKLWHLNGSTERVTSKQFLYTFHELSSLTEEEVAAINLQDHVFVSSNYTRENFILQGVDPDQVSTVPLGVDDEIRKIETTKLDGKINFSLMGKWEKRKHTAKILKLWAENFGNDMGYQLNCLVNNPFLKGDKLQSFVTQALGGKNYFNINFIPHLESNSQVNQLINRMDIDLTGLSGAEGWNLPAFNSAALGKWAIVLNATAHKDWGELGGAIMVEPNGMESSVDGLFFLPNQPFNQGDIYTWAEEDALSAINTAIEKVKSGTVNEKGLDLRKTFSYKNSVSKILKRIRS